jgi:predicted GNAT superfamily acetyltransferase
MSDSDPIVFRRAESVADYLACQEAQRKAWGIRDEGYVIPVATMVGANLHGGMVLGAFLPDGSAAAMSFGFLGRVEDRPCLYSQLTGVVPGHQSQGLGFRIKQHQRELARAEAIPRIAWAFDPLQAGNAHFNLSRLGAVATRFIPNMYGARTDTLNAGAPTDRLVVEWDTADVAPAVEILEELADALPRMIRTEMTDTGSSAMWTPIELNTHATPPALLLEIPDQITRLRAEQPALAELWREAVGRSFHWAFANGYHAATIWRDDRQSLRRVYYLLEHAFAGHPAISPKI